MQLVKHYRVFTRSSKRPALARTYSEYICWKFAGRLLDCVKTPLGSTHGEQQQQQ